MTAASLIGVMSRTLRRANQAQREVISAALRGNVFEADELAPASAKTVPASLIRELMDGKFGNVHHNGIRVARVVLDGDVDLSHMEWSGVLDLRRCEIRGDLSLAYAKIRGLVRLNGTTLQTLDCRYLALSGNLACSDGFKALRGVRGLAATISGAVSLQDAILIAPPEDENRNLAALDLYRATLGDLFLSRARLDGGLYANSASIARNVRLQGAVVSSRSALGCPQGGDAGDGVNLTFATVGGGIYLSSDAVGSLRVNGTVSLSWASCRSLSVTADQLRSISMNLNGFTYDRMWPAGGDVLLETLGNSEPFPQSAYTQLVKYASGIGDVHLARRTAIEQQRRIAKSFRLASREGVRRRALGLFVGYGYSPGRTVYWLVGCLLLTAAILKLGGFADSETTSEALRSWNQAFTLAIDHLLPFASLDEKGAWTVRPAGWREWLWFLAFILLKLGAWALAALAIASVTGLIRRSR